MKIKEIYREYIKGKSLRELEKIYGISKSQLSVIFKKKFGDNYTKMKNDYGLRSILNEYKGILNNRDKKKLEEWIKENEDLILESDLNNVDTKLYTDKQLKCMTYSECGKKEDLRLIIESTYH